MDLDWRPVSDRFWRHRAEPLLHERMWGCDLPPSPEVTARRRGRDEAGYDELGRCVGWRQTEGASEHVRHEPGVAVGSLGRGETRTVLDTKGRPVRTEYGDGLIERYEYDEKGRLVAIDEPEGLWMWCTGSDRFETGGRLTVEHIGDHVARIVAGREVVWERPVEPWQLRLERGAARIAEAVIADVDEACAEVDDAVFALCLTYVDQGSLHMVLNLGFEAGRQELLETVDDMEERTTALLYLDWDGITAGLDGYIESDRLDARDMDLLRQACISQPDDPYRVVLGAVARIISDRGLGSRVALTEDFVVYIAEHDEGTGEKFESIRSHNSPERFDRWWAAWRGGAPTSDWF